MLLLLLLLFVWLGGGVVCSVGILDNDGVTPNVSVGVAGFVLMLWDLD